MSQNFGRSASLDYIVRTGGVIANAVSSQDWPGEAAVDVAIVNWIKSPSAPPAAFVLDGEEVTGITASLRSTSAPNLAEGARLVAHRGRSYEGVKAGGRGFVLTHDEASEPLRRTDAAYGDVLRPFLISDDITSDPSQRPSRWIIDFGTMALEAALQYPAALEIVRARVKPVRDTNRRRVRRERWWQFSEPVPAMRAALKHLERYIACNAQGKRIHFAWFERRVLASNLTKVFALDTDFAIGVLTTRIHHEYARLQSSTLEDRFRYTPTTAFETFPFPTADHEFVATVGAAVIARRTEICAEQSIGPTTLYNQLDDGAWKDLRDLHRKLDEAVAAAYGWPKSVAHNPEESNRRLLELNRAIAAGEVEYDPFGER